MSLNGPPFDIDLCLVVAVFSTTTFLFLSVWAVTVSLVWTAMGYDDVYATENQRIALPLVRCWPVNHRTV